LKDLSEAVKMLAGADVKDYGGIGGLKTVSVRNLGAHHTAVSYDGICISNTQAGQIDIGWYTLDNVDQVSLAIGQTNDLMQSARHYASAGVLNITTERFPTTDKRHLTRIALRTGSFGLINPTLRHWQRLGRRTSIAADISFTHADGNYPFTLTNGREQTREKRNNSNISAWKGEVNLHHAFRDSSQLDAKAYYYYSERGLPGVVILYNPTAREKLWDENFFAQATYRKRFGSLCVSKRVYLRKKQPFQLRRHFLMLAYLPWEHILYNIYLPQRILHIVSVYAVRCSYFPAAGT
jgi:outer membrane cobalamin receptor